MGKSLADVQPSLAAQWHPTLNGDLTPQDVTPSSNKRVWWVCDKRHEWEARVNNRKSGNGCGICAGTRVLAGYNDLATLNPALASQWHPVKNGVLAPDEISPGSHKKVWWQCALGHEWQARVDTRKLGKGCPRCQAFSYASAGENEIASWLQSLGLSIQQGHQYLLSERCELDIYLPEHDFAVEFNGLYWHSEAAGKGRDYHANKVRLAQEAGITLFQVWEDDWRDRQEIVKRTILRHLGLSDESHVVACQTHITPVDTKTAEVFLNANHIQGKASASICLGLRNCENSLVAVMVLKHMPGGIIHLERYATSCLVPEGFPTLLNHVLGEFAPEKIIAFADRSISEDSLYEKHGFRVDKILSPDYSYHVRNERVHKSNYRLKRFRDDPNLEYIEGLSESQLAQLNGLHRIWDSGKTRYVLEPGVRR